MTRDPRQSINRLRKRLDESPEISNEDAEAIKAFSEQLDLLGPAEYSDHRHEFHLMRLVNMAEKIGGLAAALTDKDATEELVRWINTTYTEANGNSPETNKDYRIALRIFGQHATEGEGKPDSIAWIPSGYPGNYDPKPDPAKMLRWDEDVLPMIESCHNDRDRALIAFLWDGGPRGSENESTVVGGVSDHKYGLKVTVNGRRGRRSFTLIPSVPYVQQWLRKHPGDENPKAPLWSKLNSPEAISGTMIRKILRQAAERAGVKRPVTPTNFRKSSASYLASQGVSQSHLEAHHGWVQGSDVAGRYISVFGEAADRELAKAHGLDVAEDEPEPKAPCTCPRCQRETPRHKDYCTWCGQAMTPTAVESAKEQTERIFESAAMADGELVDDVRKLRELLTERPALRAALLET